MTHLGSWLSALADGQLPAAATERALAHVATCPRCAGELSAARAAHRALAAAAEPVAPPPDLYARLMSIAPPGAGAPPPHPDPFVPTTPLPGRSSGVLRGDVAGARGTARYVVGSIAGLGLVAASLFALGARPAVLPSAHPGLALGALGQAAAAVSTSAPVPGPATDGWTVPDLPAGWTVTTARPVDGGVEADLTGPAGPVVVSERRGHLDLEALAGMSRVQVGGRDVYLLSSQPWHVAWQCGDAVLEVLAPAGGPDLDALVAAFPAAPYDDGVPARIGRGWSVLAHAFETP